MGPKAAGISRSMGGAVWSPWPWPLRAQAGPYLSLLLIPDSHSGSSDALRPTDKPHKAGFPFPEATAQERGKGGAGAVYNHYLAAGGTYILTHVCVCVSYIRIIDHLL